MSGLLSSRVAAVGVLLPAVILGVDQLALGAANSLAWTSLPTLLVFAVFMAQSLVLAQGVGRWLPNWTLRVGVLAWALVLVNLLLFRAAVEVGGAYHGLGTDRVHLLTRAFLSAQFSAVLVWLILGSAPLDKKLLFSAAALVPPLVTLVALLAGHFGRGRLWNVVMFGQLVATLGFATLLCALRWEIAYLGKSSEVPHRVWRQFSLSQLFLVTTLAGIVAAFAKTIAAHSAGMEWAECLHVAIDAILLALLSLVAVWAAMGEAQAAVRLSALLFLAFLLGCLLSWGEAATEAIWISTARPMTGFGWRFRQSAAGAWWVGWTLLAGTFLASWLSVLHLAGYRLVRR